MFLSKTFIEEHRLWLIARKESKTKILNEGGELASIHSLDDIVRIDFALNRVADGQYGVCTECGSFIEVDRLNFMPETPFCFHCQTDIESR